MPTVEDRKSPHCHRKVRIVAARIVAAQNRGGAYIIPIIFSRKTVEMVRSYGHSPMGVLRRCAGERTRSKLGGGGAPFGRKTEKCRRTTSESIAAPVLSDPHRAPNLIRIT